MFETHKTQQLQTLQMLRTLTKEQVESIRDLIEDFFHPTSCYDKIHRLFSILEINRISLSYRMEDERLGFNNIRTDSPYEWEQVQINDKSLYHHLHDILLEYCTSEDASCREKIYADALGEPPWETEYGTLLFHRKESYPSYDIVMSKKILYNDRYRDLICHVGNKYIEKEDQQLLQEMFIMGSKSILNLYGCLSIEDKDLVTQIANRILEEAELKENIYDESSLLRLSEALTKYIRKAHNYALSYIKQHIQPKKEYTCFSRHDSHVTITIKEHKGRCRIDIAYHLLVKYKQYYGQPKPRKRAIQYRE